LARLREAFERVVRGHIDWTTAQTVVDRYADRPWFPLAWVPRDLHGHPGNWADMDYSAESVIAQVRCPTLLFYGESDEWTPAEDSIAVWRRAVGIRDLTVHRLAGCTHMPTRDGVDTIDGVSSDYTSRLLDWIGERVSR
jgi:pimeloyl-ACP methyl ester carboxylesterase